MEPIGRGQASSTRELGAFIRIFDASGLVGPEHLANRSLGGWGLIFGFRV